VPTFREIGVSQYELRIWTGVLAPAGTPKEIVRRLNQAIQDILAAPEIKTEIAGAGGEVGSTTPDDFAAFLRAERARWSALVEESRIPRVAVTPTAPASQPSRYANAMRGAELLTYANAGD
jgi:tripartite-type tricarboxylate transporter receptor subunit TctC